MMLRLLFLLLALAQVAAGPVIWNGSNSKDLTTSGLITPKINLPETGGGTDQARIQAPASLGASYTLTLPADDGADGQVLTTDGSGALSWEVISPVAQYDSGWLTSTPSTAINHGLDAAPGLVLIYYGDSSSYLQLNAGDFCNATATQLTCSWTGLTVDGTTQIRIVASNAQTGLTVDTATPTVLGTVTSYDPVAADSACAVSSANYTITDTDGCRTILLTTGASNRTLTLPTLADNQGRRITFKKVDSGTGDMVIDGEGSETIDGATSNTIAHEGATIELAAGASEWEVVYVQGEYRDAGTTNNVTGSSSLGTYTDIYSLTIDPGVWRLDGSASVAASSCSGASNEANYAQTSLAITDGSNTILQNDNAGYCNTAVVANSNSIRSTYYVRITTATTYKLRFACIGGNGSPTIGGCSVAGGTTRQPKFFATRLQ